MADKASKNFGIMDVYPQCLYKNKDPAEWATAFSSDDERHLRTQGYERYGEAFAEFLPQ